MKSREARRNFRKYALQKSGSCVLFIIERVMFYGKCNSSSCSGGFSRKRVCVYSKGKEKRREMYRMPCRRKLPGQRQTSEKEAGRTGDWQKNNKNIRDALCALRRGCGKTLNQIEGVRAEVNLSKNSARISYDRKIEDSVLKNAVEKTGYHVISIS